MQRIYIEIKNEESQDLKRLLDVNQYQYNIYVNDENTLVIIDTEEYQLNTLICILRHHIQSNLKSMQIYVAMNINFLNESNNDCKNIKK